jgi:hypothetical protein
MIPPLLSQLPLQDGDPLIPRRKQRRRLLVLLARAMILQLSVHPEPGEKVSLRRRIDATHPHSVDDILGPVTSLALTQLLLPRRPG